MSVCGTVMADSQICSFLCIFLYLQPGATLADPSNLVLVEVLMPQSSISLSASLMWVSQMTKSWNPSSIHSDCMLDFESRR